MTRSTIERYGQWAVVAGASEGIGEEFARSLASRGHDLILLARRAELLEKTAADIRAKYGRQVRTIPFDLADPAFVDALKAQTKDVEIGVAVYNAAYSVVGEILERSVDEALRVVDVNVSGPVRFVHAIGPTMVQRKRGAIILMASTSGFQGLPTIGPYAASKAFNIALGEALWAELKPRGVDVLVCCAGAVRTPGYAKNGMKEAPGMMNPQDVAETALNALGRGPRVIPGFVNRIATFIMSKLVPRSVAVTIMGRATVAIS